MKFNRYHVQSGEYRQHFNKYNSQPNFPRDENPGFKNLYKLVPHPIQFILSFMVTAIYIYYMGYKYSPGYLPGEFGGKIKSFDDFDQGVELNGKLILFTWFRIHIILAILCVMGTTHWPTPFNYSTISNLYKYTPNTVQFFLSTLITAVGTFYIRSYDIGIKQTDDLGSGSIMNVLDKPDNSDFFTIYELLIEEYPFTLAIIFLVGSFFTIFYRIGTTYG